MKPVGKAAKEFFADSSKQLLNFSNEGWWQLGYQEAEKQSIDDTTSALKNVGIDVTCGACMEIAFTGVTTNAHECTSRIRLPVVLATVAADATKSCETCSNRCMDMEMDPYCAAVNKPYGQILHGGRPLECARFELWEKDTRSK